MTGHRPFRELVEELAAKTPDWEQRRAKAKADLEAELEAWDGDDDAPLDGLPGGSGSS